MKQLMLSILMTFTAITALADQNREFDLHFDQQQYISSFPALFPSWACRSAFETALDKVCADSDLRSKVTDVNVVEAYRTLYTQDVGDYSVTSSRGLVCSGYIRGTCE